jgi:hypothetical protein
MSEQTNERTMQLFDVALWCTWPLQFPDYVGRIQAIGAYAAVVSLMEVERVEKVAYAAARQVGHPRIDRWSKVYIPLVVERRGRR